jgi:2-polyprenyl-3-methyl-5-hydroxy-6-metoxy-1,4-benzoquinol methylase
MAAPTIRTWSNPDCMLCGAAGQVLYSGMRDRLFGAPGIWQLKQCPRPECGLVWPDPAPLEEDLGLAYQTYYTHDAPVRIMGKIKHAVLSRSYRLAAAIPTLLNGLFRERIEFVHMFLNDLPAGRLFDAGCGDGRFLQLMTQRGWRGSGVDFDAAAIESGRSKYGLDLAVGDFQAAAIEENVFDAVTMSHVIEHVPDPVACFDKCRRLLKPGGRLVVTTPNSRSLGHQQFKQDWRGLEQPRHLHIFAPNLLAECARRAGLEVIRFGSTAANADYLSMASLIIKNAPPESYHCGGGWDLRFALRGVLFQFREQSAMRRNPDAGEEAYVIGQRGIL